MLAVLAKPARGSAWLRALACPPLRATAFASRGRWARDASGGGSGLGMVNSSHFCAPRSSSTTGRRQRPHGAWYAVSVAIVRVAGFWTRGRALSDTRGCASLVRDVHRRLGIATPGPSPFGLSGSLRQQRGRTQQSDVGGEEVRWGAAGFTEWTRSGAIVDTHPAAVSQRVGSAASFPRYTRSSTQACSASPSRQRPSTLTRWGFDRRSISTIRATSSGCSAMPPYRSTTTRPLSRFLRASRRTPRWH